ncbi:NmrA family NAD(P)-binding protein [Pengzhenrongella sp.]|jgi:putative NADH-flavin reductase|uniref:NmrA family NAD(P)-binding protein n=1 Tax=Pengzhenrongella sp. TaxID=2888820 RepID=UPI002F9385C8
MALPIAVIGATGQQGRSVIYALRERDIPNRALVRNPDSPEARAFHAATAPSSLRDDVLQRARLIADEGDPDRRIRRSRLLGAFDE